MSILGPSPTHYSLEGNNTLVGVFHESPTIPFFYVFSNIIFSKYLLLIGGSDSEIKNVFAKNYPFPTILKLLKIKKELIFLVLKTLQRKNLL